MIRGLYTWRNAGTYSCSRLTSCTIYMVQLLEMSQSILATIFVQIQGVSKRMTRFQIIISNNENVLELQNKLQTIKYVFKFHSP